MKHTIYFVLLILLITSVGLTSIVNGAEIEGIHFENTYEADGVRLKIQGTGLLRYLGFIKAYVGALYWKRGVL